MPKYDTYTPDAGLYGETGNIPVINPAAPTTATRRRRNASESGDVTSGSTGNSSRQRNTNRTATRTKSKATVNQPTIAQRIKSFFHNPMLRVFTGLFLMLFAAYLVICLISYVNCSMSDQVNIANTVHGQQHVTNYGGEGGARLSNILVDDGFGVGAVVIVFWLVMMSLKLLTNSKAGKFKTLNFTIKSLIALITVSLIIGLLTIGLDTPFNLGGGHGRYVNQFIIDYIGWAGAGLLCIFMLALFFGICLNDFVQWILRKKRERDAIRAERKAQMEAEAAKQREMEEMKRQDIMDDANAGEHAVHDMPDDSASEQLSNVDFVPAAATEPSATEAPHEEEMTYVYDDNDTYDNPADITEYDDTEENHQSDSETDNGESDYDTANTPTQEIQDDTHISGETGMVMKVNVNHIATVEGKESRLPQKVDSYHFPPVDLLRPAPEQPALDRNEQLENKEKIRRTLLDFGIPITDISATVGPTVTLYEIIPEPGIKISSIRNRDEDIARSLSAKGVRIIAPMPGKGTVGIEVPNKDPQIVSMRTILTSRKYQDCTYELPMAVGSTISNQVYIADLTKMPHLLVAGATGQGKSVGLNAIIASLLYRRHPSELKFVMIDPKMVELSLYSLIEKHYLAKMPGEDEAIITDVNNKVIPVLSSLCIEMDARYELLKAARVRAIKEYNAKVKRGELSPADGHHFMPYIVVVVDEYSDLIMTAGKEIEKPIARLAQKARAIGIHLIVATQRPSADVVTGMIKANFPARIAFKVSSGVDSKTILNTTAAYQLIGRGDMLVSTGGELERVQCAFIDTPEVEDICTFISQQPYEDEVFLLPEPLVNEKEGESGGFDDNTSLDPLLEEIARQIINLDKASTSAIQRRYNIGYNRAGRIMDQLERLGVVGPTQGGKPRKVMVDAQTLESILSTIIR